MADIVILAAITAAAALAIRSIARNRKNGKLSCGGDCSSCNRCRR